jgi:cysteine desulfuration protein SufE
VTGRPAFLSVETDRQGAETISAASAAIRAEFAAWEDWTQRVTHLIAIGRTLQGIEPAERRESDRVTGCQSQVWLAVEERGGVLTLRGDSDALIMRGLLALVLRVYSGRHAGEIAVHDPDTLTAFVGASDLAPSRSNGLRLVVCRIHTAAEAAVHAGLPAVSIAEG